MMTEGERERRETECWRKRERKRMESGSEIRGMERWKRRKLKGNEKVRWRRESDGERTRSRWRASKRQRGRGEESKCGKERP